MKVFLFCVLSASLFLAQSCKKYKPAQPAFFIKAGKVSVKPNSGQGSASSQITDLWLYVDGQFKGVYPVGNLMPIPNSDNGHAKIQMFAGIENNGISATRIFWNFYLPIEIDTTVENGKTISRDFTFEYRPAATFTWTENFDGQGVTLINSQNSAGSYTYASAADSFEGKSMEMSVTSSVSVGTAQIESNEYFTLPRGSSDVYLELNYKCTAPVSIGVVGSADPTQKQALVLNTKETWNKVYIQLSTVVSTEPISSKYKIYFQIYKTADYPDAKLFLDNIKLIYIP